jgi:ribose transport system permease protein
MKRLLRHRAILLAYLGMIVLLLLTSVFSPGFLSPGHLRSIAVLAAFVGIVAVGQTFVIIGGGIDLSLPWVLNCAAVLVTLLSGGQDAPLVWVMPLLLAARRSSRRRSTRSRGLFGIPPIIMTLAVNVILQGASSSIPAAPHRHGARPGPVSRGRSDRLPVVLFIWAALAAAAAFLLSKQPSDGIST